MSISLNPYLMFAGNAREAIYFYEKALGGKIIGIMAFGDMPANPEYPMADHMKDRVMHAHLQIGESNLMFSDSFDETPFQVTDAVQIAIHPTEETRAQEIFEALADGGQVILPIQKTDWSPMYGIVKDKFGITFQVNVPGQQPE
ncbi:VOC family protein [Paenibacillus sp. GCM10023250]|uniref:VOC family protein n=1 Tax=Paenibacillus sp. GCM10023250 TaxID=3252648 RepID=UPI00361076FB